eukprot:354871-Chlamydomonas_euryale.AAC.4
MQDADRHTNYWAMERSKTCLQTIASVAAIPSQVSLLRAGIQEGAVAARADLDADLAAQRCEAERALGADLADERARAAREAADARDRLGARACALAVVVEALHTPSGGIAGERTQRKES